MERNHRNTLQGVVTGAKNDKTIAVTVSTKRKDPLYAKRVVYSKKYYAHDEKNEAKIGDVVTIMACRPVSKTKRFRLISIDKKAPVQATSEAVEAELETKEGSDKEIKVEEKAPEAVPAKEAAAAEAPVEKE
jgi:small subunit ribosomal protein S17